MGAYDAAIVITRIFSGWVHYAWVVAAATFLVLLTVWNTSSCAHSRGSRGTNHLR